MRRQLTEHDVRQIVREEIAKSNGELIEELRAEDPEPALTDREKYRHGGQEETKNERLASDEAIAALVRETAWCMVTDCENRAAYIMDNAAEIAAYCDDHFALFHLPRSLRIRGGQEADE